MSARQRGFTLIEVLGVIVITTVLLGVAVNFYIDLSRQTTRATNSTREVRRATTLLDRIADDLEHTMLVRKPAEVDPLVHPWLFLGESRRGQAGADHLKFVKRVRPRSSEGPASVLAVVSYSLDRNDEGEGFALRRWTASELPDGLDREFPPPGDPDAQVVTDDIAAFAIRFLDWNGEWKEAWDSTQLIESSELPVAVEIEVALVALASGDVDADAFPEEPRRYVRQVRLPMGAIDLEALLDPEAAGDAVAADGEGEGEYDDLTLACIDFSRIEQGSVPGLSETDIATLSALALQNPDASFGPYAGYLSGPPPLKPECL